MESLIIFWYLPQKNSPINNPLTHIPHPLNPFFELILPVFCAHLPTKADIFSGFWIKTPLLESVFFPDWFDLSGYAKIQKNNRITVYFWVHNTNQIKKTGLDGAEYEL